MTATLNSSPTPGRERIFLLNVVDVGKVASKSNFKQNVKTFNSLHRMTLTFCLYGDPITFHNQKYKDGSFLCPRKKGFHIQTLIFTNPGTFRRKCDSKFQGEISQEHQSDYAKYRTDSSLQHYNVSQLHVQYLCFQRVSFRNKVRYHSLVECFRN